MVTVWQAGECNLASARGDGITVSEIFNDNDRSASVSGAIFGWAGYIESYVIAAYTFYTLTVDDKLVVTLPIVLYAIFRYFQFIYTNSKIARNPELALTDRKFVITLILWILTAFAVLYY